MSMGWKDENRSLPRSISLYEWNEFLMWMLLNEFVPEKNSFQAFHIIAQFCLCDVCDAFCRRLQMYELNHTTPHMNLENWQCKNMLFLILFYQQVFENSIPTTTVCNVMSIEYFYQIKTFLSDPTTCMEFPKNYRMMVVFSQ